MGVLDGVKVLDLTRVLAGPYCSMILADMGADVIKIELPGKGDDTRRNPPFVNEESAYYINLNRNKYSMTLNLKSEEGKKLFLELVKQSDIVLENFRPGVMDKLGLGYEDLKKVNPGIVYGCISGFGHYGPYSQRAGYDIIGQAISGLMSVTGYPDCPPSRAGAPFSDIVGGLSCCLGVVAAYTNRLRTGEGDKVDIALVDGIVSALESVNMFYLCGGEVPTRIGNRYAAVAPYESYPASDGYVIIGCGNDNMYERLRAVLKIPELDDPKFDKNTDRVKYNSELTQIIEGWTVEHTVDEIVSTMLDAGIPSSPINTIDKVVADPHIAGAREMFVDCEQPLAGKVKVTNSHFRFTNNKTSIRMHAPLMGEHTEKILKERLSLSDEDIFALKSKNVF